MPLDLGDHPARLGPASRLIGEIGMEPAHIIGWAADWPLEQISDPPLQDEVFRQTYGVFDPFGFEELVDLEIRKAGVGPKINARDVASVTRHDRVEHFLPAVRAVDVAGTQSAAFQIAELVKHEQRMITGAGITVVVSRKNHPGRHQKSFIGIPNRRGLTRDASE